MTVPDARAARGRTPQDVTLRARSSVGSGPDRPLCAAPSSNLYLAPTGEVRSCCASQLVLGNLWDQSLPEIWTGSLRQRLEERLRVGDLGLGCDECAAQLHLEGHDFALMAGYDALHERSDPSPDTSDLPVSIEFELSNICNLQCIQCNGESSSAIRHHREGRTRLRSPYGEAFFEDLRTFIPRLSCATFAGGEPFLEQRNYRVWEMVRELNPRLPVTVVTNATRWNRRTSSALDGLNVDFRISLDGATPDVFESIRKGADFGEVMRNIADIIAHVSRAGGSVSINHCLMAQNVHEFPEMVLLAERSGVMLNVLVVRDPPWCSVLGMPKEELRKAVDRLRQASDGLLPQLRLNRALWLRELDRLSAWVSADAVAIEAARGKSAHVIMGMSRTDGSACRSEELVEELTRSVPGGELYWLRVLPGDSIDSWSAGLDDLIRTDGLRGQPIACLPRMLSESLGRVSDWSVVLGQRGAAFSGDFGRAEVRGGCSLDDFREGKARLGIAYFVVRRL